MLMKNTANKSKKLTEINGMKDRKKQTLSVQNLCVCSNGTQPTESLLCGSLRIQRSSKSGWMRSECLYTSTDDYHDFFHCSIQHQQQTIRRRGRMSTLLRALHVLENIFRGRQLFFSHFSCDLDLIAATDTHTAHTHSHAGCSPVTVIGAFICPLDRNCSGYLSIAPVCAAMSESLVSILSVHRFSHTRTHSQPHCLPNGRATIHKQCQLVQHWYT